MPIHAHIIGGHLGTGKTTAVLHLLRSFQQRGVRCAVLVNDFGELGIDGEVVSQERPLVVKEINGGCICCTLLPYMSAALAQIARNGNVERLFVEPTGLALPHNFEHLFNEPALAEAYTLHPLVTLIDPGEYVKQLSRPIPYFEALITNAEILAVNKIDACGPEAVEQLRVDAARLNPGATFVAVSFGQIPLEILDRPSRKTVAHPPVPDSANLALQVTRLGFQKPAEDLFDAGRLRDFFNELREAEFPLKPLRAKGIFHCPDGWRLLQLSGSGVTETLLNSTPSLSRCDMIFEQLPPERRAAVLRRLRLCLAA
jgi:G3E family GTPase